MELSVVIVACAVIGGWLMREPQGQVLAPIRPAPEVSPSPAPPQVEPIRPKKRTAGPLPPSALGQLPPHISAWLTRQGLVIPQEGGTAPAPRSGAVQGEFQRFGQTDWAVLVTRDQKTCFVLIFWAGQCPPTRLFDGPLVDMKGSCRWLRVATPRFIRENLTSPPRQAGYPPLSEPRHDGINCGGYFTQVHYFQDGLWFDLPCSRC